MKAWPLVSLAVAAALLTSRPTMAADEDADLERIPSAAPLPPAIAAPESANAAQRNYLENAFSVGLPRHHLAVPLPPPTPASWENRLFLDSRDEWRLNDSLTLAYSGRFNLRAANDIPFPSHENVRNDLREAFLSWQATQGIWLDLGRINVKSGVAIGYNPTDFFRTRAVVEPLTADPRVLREDRLGTLMVRAQYVWAGGSMSAAYAPRVTRPTAIYSNVNLPSFDPVFDRTNAQDRFLLKGNVLVADGLSPELLFYHSDNRTQFGANLTVGIGQQTIAYAEWAGGVRGTLIEDALSYGRRTGSLPAASSSLLPAGNGRVFRHDLSVGVSYTLAAGITFNLEYHYHQAGLSAEDWRRWFDTAARQGGARGVNSTLWYIRGYAQDQQEPTARHAGFFRADWVDAFVPDLELTALGSVNLVDGSGFLQAAADYYLSRLWTVGGLASVTFGGRRSEFGSLPQVGTALVRLVRYL